jgi:hypothetical protein
MACISATGWGRIRGLQNQMITDASRAGYFFASGFNRAFLLT